MNNFATIKHIGTFLNVCFYSLTMNESTESMYEEFYNTYNNDLKYKEDLELILSQIKSIGKRGAFVRYFRHEGSAEALPTFVLGENESNMRLYCVRLTDNIVFLLSGGLKTTQKAQDCPNVASHFHIANKISKALTLASKNKDITIEENIRPRLDFEKDFELHF